jgi:S1-C subfamily serine protease
VNLLDLLLLIAAAVFAVSGYRRGFVVGVLSFVGFLGGGILGMKLAPLFLGQVAGSSPASSIVAILIVLGLAMVGQVLAAILASRLRQYITWHPAKVVDATAGAFVSAVSVLLVAWFLGSAVATADLPPLSTEVRGSSVLRAVTRVMPPSASTWFSSFSSMLDENGFPQVFNPFTNEPIVDVPPPDPAVSNSVAVRRARGSIVRVLGTARSCSREIEGTGFAYAPQRVMTNAHVVAGVRSPRVEVRGRGPDLPARVVLFDPKRDIAVLYVPDLDVAPLRFDTTGKARDSAVVAGFPRNGPFRVDAARIRSEINARGPDIYQRSTVTRKVFSLLAPVQPGNSGGPLLSPAGDVYGVIFAKSLENDNTGYAVTAAEVAGDARSGAESLDRVSTGACA